MKEDLELYDMVDMYSKVAYKQNIYMRQSYDQQMQDLYDRIEDLENTIKKIRADNINAANLIYMLEEVGITDLKEAVSIISTVLGKSVKPAVVKKRKKLVIE